MSSASSSGASSRSERIAWRARRSPTKRGSRRFAAPGMIPSLRAGSVQRVPASARMWSTTSSSWQPPPIANVSAAAIHSFSTSGCAQPAEHLVDETEVSHGEEQVGDLAAVEMREVQAGAEDPLAGVARVLDDAAAQDADLDRRVEQDEVDRRFERAGGGVVLGVEVARVAQLDGADVAGSRDGRGPEIDAARSASNSAWCSSASFGRAQHHVDQVTAGLRVGEDVAEQLALRDLVAVLVLLQPLALVVDDQPPRRQPGDALGGGVDELVGAQAAASRCP